MDLDSKKLGKSLNVSSAENKVQGHSKWQRRYTITLLGFLCLVLISALRVNMSIAIVAMVNTTSIQPNIIGNNRSECLLPEYEEEFQVTSNPEFAWGPLLQGYILSAGNLGNVLTQIPGGILAGIFGVKSVLLVSIVFSSLCNLLTPVAARQHPFLLIAVQLFRGMFQGLIPAAFSILMAKWLPKHERGFLSTFMYCGFPAGAFIGEIISGALCELNVDRGWPLVFYVFGMIGILVSLLTAYLYAETPSEDARISKGELEFLTKYCVLNSASQEKRPSTPWKLIFKSGPTYALLVSLFGAYWMTNYFLTSHPMYMGAILHIPIKENGILSSGPQVGQMVTGVAACYFSFWFTRKSKSNVNFVRKGSNTLASFAYALGIVGMYFSNCDTLWNEIWLFIAISSDGFCCAGSLISAVDLTPTFCGVLMGFSSCFASLSSFLIPIIVGFLTNEEQTMAQWHKVFLITAAVSAGSGLVFLLFGSTDIQPYDPLYSKSDKVEKSSKKEEKQTVKGDISNVI